MPRSVLRVGTRGHALALAQAERVRQAVAAVITHRNFELVPVVTPADDAPRDEPPDPLSGAYVDEIEDALALGKIDLAVHCADDLSAAPREGVAIAAVFEREDPREALVTRSGRGLASLQPGTHIVASTPARAAQIVAMQRGLVPTPMHAPLDVLLRELGDADVSALLVSLAGLVRLGRADRAAEILPINAVLPVPGQGTMVVECRANDKMMRPALAQLDDARLRAALDAERSFMLALSPQRLAPIAALAEAGEGTVRLRGLVAAPDGKRIIQDQIEGDDPEKTGIALAERLRGAGADEILSAEA
jgi:hydroxymethylbilane synthase